jgi:hypothetical protein
MYFMLRDHLQPLVSHPQDRLGVFLQHLLQQGARMLGEKYVVMHLDQDGFIPQDLSVLDVPKTPVLGVAPVLSIEEKFILSVNLNNGRQARSWCEDGFIAMQSVTLVRVFLHEDFDGPESKPQVHCQISEFSLIELDGRYCLNEVVIFDGDFQAYRAPQYLSFWYGALNALTTKLEYALHPEWEKKESPQSVTAE